MAVEFFFKKKAIEMGVQRRGETAPESEHLRGQPTAMTKGDRGARCT